MAAKKTGKRTGLSDNTRTLKEGVASVRDRNDDDLGKRSPITRAKRAVPTPVTQMSPLEAMKQQVLMQNSSDLRAKSGAPTLAQRVAQEGAAAYGGKFKNARRPGEKKAAKKSTAKKAAR